VEEHEKLKAAVTKWKAVLSGKRAVVDGKHILTMLEIHDDLVIAEKERRKGRPLGQRGVKRGASETAQESSDESEASQDGQLRILDCIEVQQ
jgi:hypothetical protein